VRLDIYSLYKPLAEFEAKVGDLYEWFSGLFKDDPEAAFAFFQLAAEERAHVAIIEYQRRLVRANAKDFGGVTVDLQPIEEATALVEKVRGAAEPPSLEEALRTALALETSAAEYHYKTAMKQSNASLARLLDALGTADRNHLGRLVAFAKQRGVEAPGRP
jgi:rubrerythrin